MKRIFLLIMCLVMLTSMFAACGSEKTPANNTAQPSNSAPAQTGDSGTPAPGSKGTIKLGVLAPLTGPNAEYGYGFQVAVDMAVKEVNAKGGFNGYTLEYVLEDSAGDPAQSADLARKYAEDDSIMAILGDYTSGCCMANAPIVEEYGILQLSPSASSPQYTIMNKWCFGTVGRTTDEIVYYSSAVIRDYLGGKTVGVMYVNSDYGKINRDGLLKQAPLDGVEVVAEESFLDGDTDFSAIINKVRAAKPDVVMIIDTGNVDKIVNQIAQTDWKPKLAILGPSTSEQLVENTGKNIEGAVTTTPFFYDESNKELITWLNEFKSIAGYSPTLHIPGMRDAVYLIGEAIKACGDNEVTREALRDNLEKVDFEGLCGRIRFNDDRTVSKKYYIFQVNNGKWEVVVDRPE